MPKYIFSNGLVRTTAGFSQPRSRKGKQELATVVIVFPNATENQAEQEKVSKKDDESPLSTKE
jgi:hypothetical protein